MSYVTFSEKQLSLDEIARLFVIDAETGYIHWRERGPGRSMRKPIGCLTTLGYRKIGLRPSGEKYIQYYAHRIIWAHHYREWPDFPLDHINGDKDDNRIANLRRSPSTSHNRVNTKRYRTNVSGYKWVSPHRNRWQAAVWFGEERRQKYFKSKEAAYEWACEQAKELHGEFYRGG